MYAKLEEDHGLARHAMAIYERSTKAVQPDEQYEVCQVFLYRLYQDKCLRHYLRVRNV